MQTVAVAGASGALGRHVVRELKRQGYGVRALVRDPRRLDGAALRADEVRVVDLTRPDTLRGACSGVDAVLSCAGASMRLGNFRDRSSFHAVDYRGNASLLASAREAGAQRFVYVSLYDGPRLRHTAYAAAHERFVEELRRSGLPHAVVRPTGYFSVFAEVLRLARQGRAAVVGAGTARTNPIAEEDLAEVCVAALASEQQEIPVGGPRTYTRREIVELALAAAGRPARTVQVPPRVLTGAALAMRPLNPRLAALLEFGAAVGVVDAVAPAYGTRTLDAFFRERAG